MIQGAGCFGVRLISTQVVHNRMKSVKNIQKNTKAMKMVAASKLQAVRTRAEKVGWHMVAIQCFAWFVLVPQQSVGHCIIHFRLHNQVLKKKVNMLFRERRLMSNLRD